MKYTKSLLATLMLSTGLTSFAESIDIWAWNINVPVVKKAAELYMQQHPDAEINVIDTGRNDVYTKVNIGLQAKGKGLPDVFLVEDEYFSGFLANWPNAFVDLSAKGYDKYSNDFPEFKKAVLQADGKFYAMPFDIGPVGVFYRRDIFEQAGIDPASIQTWDDYIAAGKKIKETTGSFMTNVGTDDDGFYRTLMQERGVGYFDRDGNIDYNSPASLESLTLIDEMEKAGILYTSAKGWDGFVQAITTGKIVAIPSGAWLAGTIESNAPDMAGKWGVMALPQDSQGRNAANVGGSNFTIVSTSEHIDLAYDFMEFFTTDVGNQVVAFKGGLFPSFMPVYQDPAFMQGVPYFGDQPIWEDLSKVVQDIPEATYTIDYSIAREEGNKIVAEAITTDKDPAKILSDAAKRLANQTGRKINKY